MKRTSNFTVCAIFCRKRMPTWTRERRGPLYNMLAINISRVYRVVLELNEHGGFTVTAPALPAIVTHGDTREESLENAADAIRLYIESFQARGLPVREDR